MTSERTWEEQTRIRIERAKAHLAHAEKAYQHWSSRVKALEDALRLELEGFAATSHAETREADFRSMSVNDALIEIAKQNGGLVVTRQAIQILCRAGVYDTRSEANDGIHTTLRRSKDFRKEGRGIYRYVPASERVNGQSASNQIAIANVEPISAVLSRLLKEHENWGHAELVAHLVHSGYNFQGKKPGLVVNMALQRIKRRKAQPALGQQPELGNQQLSLAS